MSKDNQEYLFLKDGEQWCHTIYGTEFKVAKAVYSSFTDTSLDLFDESWDVIYLDGNPLNCHVDNLARK
jgi:hypothetical protein